MAVSALLGKRRSPVKCRTSDQPGHIRARVPKTCTYFILKASKVPPKTLAGVRRGIGPALIIGAGVVGTGELIATTVLGAENGYSLLWLILVSCTIKVVMQNELGRCAIGTGETGLQALERAPGPRFRASWVVWLWSFMLATSLVTPSGMFAGIS